MAKLKSIKLDLGGEDLESYGKFLQYVWLNKVDIDENSDKFYFMAIQKDPEGRYRIVSNYGRRGTEGVYEARYADDLSGAEEEFDRILKEKISTRKGYSVVESG